MRLVVGPEHGGPLKPAKPAALFIDPVQPLLVFIFFARLDMRPDDGGDRPSRNSSLYRRIFRYVYTSDQYPRSGTVVQDFRLYLRAVATWATVGNVWEARRSIGASGRQGAYPVQTGPECLGDLHGGKPAGNASLQSGPPITHPVHVAAHDDGFIWLYIHRPAGVSVEKHSPVDELSAGRHNFPPVSIPIASGVGTPDRYRKAVRAGLAADGYTDHVRMVPRRDGWWRRLNLRSRCG